jgi:hypothetical protein
MTKAILAALSGATILAGAGWAQDSRDVEIGDFDRIEARGGLRVEIVHGDTPGVRLEGDESDFDDIEVSVQGDRLRVEQDTGWFMRNRQLDVVVHVTVNEIESLEFSRGISARVSGIAADHIDIDINTGAAARLSGTCRSADIGLSTGVSLHGQDLVCETVEVSASTGAEARVHATARIEARASMGAAIRVFGSPADRDVRSSMGGDIAFDRGN